MNKTENLVSRFLARHRMLRPGGLYLVALSGGADSVALTLMLQSLGVNIHAAHCNFHLRGEESDRDEQFCVALCQRQNIPLHRIHFDTASYAHLHKVSVEMAARDLRYRYFHQLIDDIGGEGICVAHHRDDNVETLLLNLLRGSGIDGLAAIAPVNGRILRPLLCIGRSDILAYLEERGQDYVTDSTNLEDDALRNQIRHHVVPLLQTLNPAASDNIAQSAQYIRQAKVTIDSLMSQPEGCEEAEDGCVEIPTAGILGAASPEFALHWHLGKYGFHGDVVESVLESLGSTTGGVGRVWKSSSHLVAADRGKLTVAPLSLLESLRAIGEMRIPEEGCYRMPGEWTVRVRRYARPSQFEPSKEPMRITLDADKVAFPLVCRLTKEGDRFRPFGMRGTKLVSDFLTDRKLDTFSKMRQRVIADAHDSILWLVGLRTAEEGRVTDQTSNVLEISVAREFAQ